MNHLPKPIRSEAVLRSGFRHFAGMLVIALAAMGLSLTAMAAEVTDEEVELFATASINVQEVTDEYEARLEDASDEEQQELVVEMTERMQQAVEDSGLTWQRYQDIVFEAGADQNLNERIIAEIQAQGGGA